jgi:hypothetical protein
MKWINLSSIADKLRDTRGVAFFVGGVPATPSFHQLRWAKTAPAAGKLASHTWRSREMQRNVLSLLSSLSYEQKQIHKIGQ